MVARRSVGRGSRPSLPSLPEVPPSPTIPKTNRDPVLSLCPWSIEISLGDCKDPSCSSNHYIEIPPLPAIEWLKFLLSTDPDINGLISDLMPGLDDFYFDNEQSIEDMYRTALEAVEVASARAWWVALRLIHTAADNWHIIGPKLIINGIDAETVSLAAWLDVALYLMIESMDPKDVTIFSMRLEAPPISTFVDDTTVPEPVMDRAAFLAMAR